jgi:hypothetical protein
MRPRFLALIVGTSVTLSLACKKDEQPPPQQPQPYYQPAPAPSPAPVATQPGPAPTVAQPAPTTTTPGTMAQPSPMALPCTSDAACLTHKCNLQFGKCAWPCQTEADCNPGNQCMAGACVPKMQ